jgi:DNA-binding MarR family transcriptional regulator
MDDRRKQAILQEMIELTEMPEIQPEDVTLDEYAEVAGITKGTAKSRLKKLVDAGKFETMIVRCPDGKHRRVYRRRLT